MSYTRKTKLNIVPVSKPALTQEEYLVEFKKLLDEMYNTTAAKNHDYASTNDAFRNFREFGKLGVLVRMSDKFARLKSALVEKKDFKVKDESILDTAKDLAVYSLILMLMVKYEPNS